MRSGVQKIKNNFNSGKNLYFISGSKNKFPEKAIILTNWKQTNTTQMHTQIIATASWNWEEQNTEKYKVSLKKYYIVQLIRRKRMPTQLQTKCSDDGIEKHICYGQDLLAQRITFFFWFDSKPYRCVLFGTIFLFKNNCVCCRKDFIFNRKRSEIKRASYFFRTILPYFRNALKRIS